MGARVVPSAAFGLPAGLFVAAVYEMAAGGAFLMLGAVALGEPGQLDGGSFTAASVSAWLYLVVAGSLVGFSAYAWLLRVAPISLVVTHQYVNPLVAIALGMLLRRAAEPVDARRRLRRRRRRLRGDPRRVA